MTRFSLTSAALIISTLLFHQSRAADPLPSKVLTKEQQAELTPQSVLTELIAGNKRFTSNVLTERNHSKQVREAYAGQFPKAVVLSCLDSRIPVEDVFDRGVGDIFVARVAGNFINEDILGSMEFACHVAGAKLIIVLGHTHCGAVQAAIDNVQLGNITPMLAKIRPALSYSVFIFRIYYFCFVHYIMHPTRRRTTAAQLNLVSFYVRRYETV